MTRAAEVAVLVHHGNAHPGRARDHAAIGIALAGQQLHQRGLAGAVAADDAPAFAALDLEGDAGEQRVGAEDDREVAGRDQGHVEVSCVSRVVIDRRCVTRSSQLDHAKA